MIAGTASMGFRSEEITRDRERREEKASEKAPAPAPNTPVGKASEGEAAAPPVPLRRMSTLARMSRSMSKIKAPIPKFFRKGVVAVSSDAAGEIVARMAQDQPVSFRERLFLVMTEPSTGRVAKLVATFSWTGAAPTKPFGVSLYGGTTEITLDCTTKAAPLPLLTAP